MKINLTKLLNVRSRVIGCIEKGTTDASMVAWDKTASTSPESPYSFSLEDQDNKPVEPIASSKRLKP